MRAFVLYIAAAAAIFAGAKVALAGDSKASTAEEIVHYTYHRVLLKCPERIWPGLDWSQTQILLTSFAGDEPRAWLVHAESPEAPESIDFDDDIPEGAYTDGWEIFEFRGKSTVAVSLDNYQEEDIRLPMRVAVHELFHKMAQENWILPRTRGDLYPLAREPRELRAMALQSLQRDQLGEAAGWYSRWQMEWPEEMAVNTDAREGTARYVEQMALILSESGCHASHDDILARAETWIKGLTELEKMDLDLEGYLIGAVAGFRLDRAGTEWKSVVSAGLSAPELLLGGRQIETGTMDTTLEEAIRSHTVSRNWELSKWLDPHNSRVADTRYVRVALPRSWTHTVSLTSFIPLTDPNRTDEIFEGGQGFDSPTEGYIALQDTQVAYRPATGGPCPDALAYFLVREDQIKERQAHFQVFTKGLDLELDGDWKTVDGFRYICPKR